MYGNIGVDLDLPRVECESAATPFEFEYPYDVDATALDNATHFSPTSALDHMLDCGLPGQENCHADPTTLSWPMLNPLFLSHFTDSPLPSNKYLEDVPVTREMASEPDKGQYNLQEADQVQKKKGSQRPHYAVEKRYRSSLNDKYATLAQLISSEAVQRICRTEQRDWPLQVEGSSSISRGEQGAESRLQKTSTLSSTIDTISILNKCCGREEKTLKQLQEKVQNLRRQVQSLLDARDSPNCKQFTHENSQF